MAEIAIRIPDRFAGKAKVFSTPMMPVDHRFKRLYQDYVGARMRELEEEVRRMLSL